MVKGLALMGDVLRSVHVPFPITSGRFRSMTSDYITPMDQTIAALGEAPWTLAAGVKETVRWYDHESTAAQAPLLRDVRQLTHSERQ
jgi:hypothetical protein